MGAKKQDMALSQGNGSLAPGSGAAAAGPRTWNVAKVIEATGGRLVDGSRNTTFAGISTDSRLTETGDLFVALQGDKFDGEKFCLNAVKHGAAGVLVAKRPATVPGVSVIVVADTLRALGDLATFRRAEMKRLKVLAITGSSGKTTVKEMTASILARRFSLIKTKGNFNNLIGLPLSLLPVNDDHQLAIMEMGMNRAGEIARMTEIARPDLACINNIQTAHLQGLSSIEGVAGAKGELFAGMGRGGVLVVNLEDPLVRKLARRSTLEKITFGWRRRAMVRGTYLHNRGEDGFSFTLAIGRERGRVRLQCLGRHNVLNALAAASLAHGAGADFADICHGLAEFTPYDKRLQIEKVYAGLKVVNDTYNANPASMLAALETVRGLKGKNRTVAILGDMLELGNESEAAHGAIGGAVASLGFDYLLTCGSFAEFSVQGAIVHGMDKSRALALNGKDEIVEGLHRLVREEKIGAGDWLLVKGSRGAGMETIIAALREDS